MITSSSGRTFLPYQARWQRVLSVAWIPFIGILLLTGYVFPAVFSLEYSNIVSFFFHLITVVPGICLWLGTIPFAPAVRPRFRTAADVIAVISGVFVLGSFLWPLMVVQNPDWYGDGAPFGYAGTFGFIVSHVLYRRAMVKNDLELRYGPEGAE